MSSLKTIEDYQEQVLRTVSQNFYGKEVRGLKFLEMFDQLIAISEQVDLLKKALFYGKEIKGISIDPRWQTVTEQVEHGQVSLSDLFPKTELEYNTLHALLGLLTETTEALQNFFSEEYSELNQLEEVGDLSWYYALLLKSVKHSPSEVWEANIRKLKARYPQNFETEKALNRDLVKEEIALQGS